MCKLKCEGPVRVGQEKEHSLKGVRDRVHADCVQETVGVPQLAEGDGVTIAPRALGGLGWGCVCVVGAGTCISQGYVLALRRLNLKENIFPSHEIICVKCKAKLKGSFSVSQT